MVHCAGRFATRLPARLVSVRTTIKLMAVRDGLMEQEETRVLLLDDFSHHSFKSRNIQNLKAALGNLFHQAGLDQNTNFA